MVPLNMQSGSRAEGESKLWVIHVCGNCGLRHHRTYEGEHCRNTEVECVGTVREVEVVPRSALLTAQAKAEEAEQRAKEFKREALSQARMKAECYEEWKIAEQRVAELEEVLRKIDTRSPDGTGKPRPIWSDKEMQKIARSALQDTPSPNPPETEGKAR